MEVKVEFLDKVMDLFQRASDQQIRCMISFKDNLHVDILRKAIQICLQNEPVALSRFNCNSKEPLWELVTNASINTVFTFKELTKVPDQDINDFFIERIDSYNEPQIKIALFRKDNKDTLLFMIHHTASDGYGLLSFIRRIRNTYNAILDNKEDKVSLEVLTDRSIDHLLTRKNLFYKIKGLFYSFKVKNSDKIQPFPYVKASSDENKMLFTHGLSGNDFDLIKSYCVQNNHSINDLLLAIIYKTFYSYRNMAINEEVLINPIFVTISLRNHFNKQQANALFNFSTGLVFEFSLNPNSDIESIIIEIKKRTSVLQSNLFNKDKSNVPGLISIYALQFLLKILPFKVIKKKFSEKKGNEQIESIPNIANLGNIAFHVDKWSGSTVDNAIALGQIAYKPGFSMLVSQFNEKINFSIGFIGNTFDGENINSFFNKMDKIVKELIIKK